MADYENVPMKTTWDEKTDRVGFIPCATGRPDYLITREGHMRKLTTVTDELWELIEPLVVDWQKSFAEELKSVA